MIYIIILSVFIFAVLTFFSGFGLATVLTPVFILFFPVPVAIGLTAIVHFFNNVFKFFLVGKRGSLEVVLKFGLPAMLGALLGSLLFLAIVEKSFKVNYHIFNHNFHVELVNLIIGLLIFILAIFEIIPLSNKIAFNKKLLPFGGILSGFLGGLSGHQGAFRSVFLLKCNLTKEQFIATGIQIAFLVDIVRLPVYWLNFLDKEVAHESGVMLLSVIFAFLGSYLANKYMQKMTIKIIQVIIALMLLIISVGLIIGLI